VHSYAVSVLGEVRNPGRFQFQSQITVLDALAQAGGLTEFAARRDIQILRPGPEGIQRMRFNYRDVMRSDDGLGSQMYIYPGDTILVP
jgi:polysaccharide export outer membrane protein